MTPTKIFLSTNENPLYVQFWPLIASAWTHLGFEPVLALSTNKDISKWKWMEDYGEVVHFKEHDKIPSGNWAKLVRWWLYFRYENEVGIVSDIDMLPLQRDYFARVPDYYEADKHLFIKGTYDNSLTGKFPGCYMTAKGSVWKEILNPDDKYADVFEWAKQFEGRQMYDLKEDPLTPHHQFSEESLMRSVVLQWDPTSEKTIRWARPGGWQHDIFSTSLRVDRGAWPHNQSHWNIMGFGGDKSYPNNMAHPLHHNPHEDYYIDSHLLRPLQQYKDHIIPLIKYVGVSEELIELGIRKSEESFGTK
jgi:hypothetical protein